MLYVLCGDSPQYPTNILTLQHHAHIVCPFFVCLAAKPSNKSAILGMLEQTGGMNGIKAFTQQGLTFDF